MELNKKHVLLITSGQPSLNPRLVKEADALVEFGYQVTVLYQYWNDWGSEMDKQLLATKKWKALLIGGTPYSQQFLYFKLRIIQKIAILLAKCIGVNNWLSTYAIGRCTPQLIKQAKAHKADIYIAHNLAALPSAVLAAKKNNGKCGFDAEDFHRNEQYNEADNFDVKLKRHTEDLYFGDLDYLSTASPLISSAYKKLYPSLYPVTILNVFLKKHIIKKPITKISPLKLFWFSQTIGINRGLETVIDAISQLKEINIELHLLGNHNDTTQDYFFSLARSKGINSNTIYFYHPIHPDCIFEFASRFDIGLATEIRHPLNRDICLTNKIFTYIHAQLAIVASNTAAQEQFLAKFNGMGIVFNISNPKSLSSELRKLANDRNLLIKYQQQAKIYADEILNWDVEKTKFINLINSTLTGLAHSET